MKEIFDIFKNDVKKICSQKFTIIIILGIMIIPGIYAWLNIDSNWNPYDNTGNLPIAIVNKDQGMNFLGTDINMGKLLEDSLRENNAMKWIFTDEQTAKSYVDESIYYGALIIPENFSSKFLTLFDSDKLEKPTFDFYVNQKKNPIAPIIVSKAISTIQTTLNQNFVNAVIYKMANTAEELDIMTKQAKSTEELISKLTKAKEDVSKLRAVIKTLSIASDSVTSSLNAVRNLFPTVESITGSTRQGIDSMKNAVNSFNNSYNQMTDDISDVLSSIKNIGLEMSNTVSGTDSNNISENLDLISTNLKEMEARANTTKSIFETLDNALNIEELQNMQEENTALLDEIHNIQAIIENSNNTIENLEDIKTKITQLNTDISNLNTEYSDSVKSEINSAYANASNSLSDVTSLASKLSSSLTKTDTAMANMIDALDNTNELTENIDVILFSFQTDIDKIIETISSETETELYAKMVKLLQNDPNVIADYLTSLVDTNEINLYEIDSYGSKMAPFYTILACWVGCTLLVSLLKTDIKENEKTKNYKNYQKFLGRFMLFAVIAIIQGLIIGIGDIILQVQVLNIPLFLTTIMLSSLTFMTIVYALTISFGKVGEAAAVVIMVLQVAGSGGTFPIELLPRPFQILQPFMPFYPAMSALRETIGGLYGNVYITCMLQLFIYLVLSLLLGLGFRKRIIHLKRKVDEQLEKTDVII